MNAISGSSTLGKEYSQLQMNIPYFLICGASIILGGGGGGGGGEEREREREREGGLPSTLRILYARLWFSYWVQALPTMRGKSLVALTKSYVH